MTNRTWIRVGAESYCDECRKGIDAGQTALVKLSNPNHFCGTRCLDLHDQRNLALREAINRAVTVE